MKMAGDIENLIKENEQLKSALKDLIKEKNTMEYLVFKSFMKILNAKKQKIKKLEEQIKTMEAEKISDQETKKAKVGKKNQWVGSDTSSEGECSTTFYDKDTDVEDSDENEKKLVLKLQDTHQKISPLKRFVESSDSIGSKKGDDSETDLSQSQSQENYSQCLLKPYSNSISSDDDCETNLSSKKLCQEENSSDKEGELGEGPGPSKAKRKKALDSTTDSDLLEELLGDL